MFIFFITFIHYSLASVFFINTYLANDDIVIPREWFVFINNFIKFLEHRIKNWQIIFGMDCHRQEISNYFFIVFTDDMLLDSIHFPEILQGMHYGDKTLFCDFFLCKI